MDSVLKDRIDRMSDFEKRDLQQKLANEVSKAKVQESKSSATRDCEDLLTSLMLRCTQSHQHVLDKMCHRLDQIWSAGKERGHLSTELCGSFHGVQ